MSTDSHRSSIVRKVIRVGIIAFVMTAALAVRLRIGRDWIFAGADSYAYMELANELHREMRYARGPAPEPLYYARPPAYPIVLSALLVEDGPNWFRRDSRNWRRMRVGQSILEVIALGLLSLTVARRFASFPWAAAAMSCVLFWPFTIVMSNMILAEWLATVLTLAAIAMLLSAQTQRWRWFAAGVLVGAAFLARVDSILLIAPCAVALVGVRDGWRSRATLGGLVLLGLVVAVGPWALRNTLRFGHPYLTVTGLDYHSQPAPTVGFRKWLATWADGVNELKKFEYCFTKYPVCSLSIDDFPPHAFAGELERSHVQELIELHDNEGFTSQVSDGFDKIAYRRQLRNPLRILVALPLERAARLWLTPPDDIHARPDWRPWPGLFSRMVPWFGLISWLLFVTTILSLAILSILPNFRLFTAITGTTLVSRTLALAYEYYPEPRYIFEVVPIALIVIFVCAYALSKWTRKPFWSTRRALR